MNTPLDCQSLVEVVTDYLEDALPMADRRVVDEHLAECEDCLHHVDQMLRTIEMTARLADAGEVVPSAALDALLATFQSTTQQNE